MDKSDLHYVAIHISTIFFVIVETGNKKDHADTDHPLDRPLGESFQSLIAYQYR